MKSVEITAKSVWISFQQEFSPKLISENFSCTETLLNCLIFTVSHIKLRHLLVIPIGKLSRSFSSFPKDLLIIY